MVGLLGEAVLVSSVWMLPMGVSGLSFVSVAVGASMEMSGSGSWSWGGQWAVLCREVARWAVLCGGTCWAVRRQAQSSLMVRHWNAGGVGMWIVQCW
jgi:hypothetical protein